MKWAAGLALVLVCSIAGVIGWNQFARQPSSEDDGRLVNGGPNFRLRDCYRTVGTAPDRTATRLLRRRMIAALETFRVGRLSTPGPVATGDLFDLFALGVDHSHRGEMALRFDDGRPVLLVAGHNESLKTLRGRIKCSQYRSVGRDRFRGAGDRRRFRWILIRRGSLVAGDRRSAVERLARLTSAR